MQGLPFNYSCDGVARRFDFVTVPFCLQSSKHRTPRLSSRATLRADTNSRSVLYFEKSEFHSLPINKINRVPESSNTLFSSVFFLVIVSFMCSVGDFDAGIRTPHPLVVVSIICFVGDFDAGV